MNKRTIILLLPLLITVINEFVANSCCTPCCAPCTKPCGPASCKPCRDPKTIFVPRSQSVNAARDMIGTQRYMNLSGIGDPYGCFSTVLEYTRSFKPDLISDYLWGRAETNGTLVFSGSNVTNRGEWDILADYFGLPQDFESLVTMKPRIQNFIVGFNLYVGLDKWAENAYFRLNFPLVHTRWSLNAGECVLIA